MRTLRRLLHQFQSAANWVSLRGASGKAGYTSLRRKLATLIAGGGVVAAMIAAAGFAWFDLTRYWQHADAEVSAIAAVVAGQVGPAITLGNLDAAAAILGSVGSDAMIRDAMLYDVGGG